MSDLRRRRGVRVFEPALDASTINVNGKAVLLNIVLVYGFGVAGYVVPALCGVARRGFFCDDDSIRYESLPDTVSAMQLFLYNIILNAVTVLAVEYYRIQKVENEINVKKYRWRDSHLHVLFVRLITYFGYSQIGFVVNLTLNTATKNMIGRLRPSFLDLCRLANDTCVTGNQHKYITEYTCLGDAAKILDARKSFYSGHSAISMYCAVWSALYLQARITPVLLNKIIVPILQTCFVIAGLGISFSRITDNKHHWSDVLVGISAGTFVATYTCVHWTNIFKNSQGDESGKLLISHSPDHQLNQLLNTQTSSVSGNRDLENSTNYQQPEGSAMTSITIVPNT